MGFARRVVRKSVRKATPRSVRKVMNPVGTLKSAVTPRPVKQLSRAVYTVTNPLGAAENALTGAALHPGRSSTSRSRSTSGPRSTGGRPAQASGTGIRAQEAAAVHDDLMQLFAAGRQRFTPTRRPVMARPERIDIASHVQAEWARRKREVGFSKRTARKELHSTIDAQVGVWAESQYGDACARADAAQEQADAWWARMESGEPATLAAALNSAFADNPAPATALHARGPHSVVAVLLPGMEVLPATKAHVTPTGKLSSKAWTKTELNDIYADLLAAHLLATAREAFAVGPTLQSCRVIGTRHAGGPTPELLFDVNVSRQDAADEVAAYRLLQSANAGLVRQGRTAEVVARAPEATDKYVPQALRFPG